MKVMAQKGVELLTSQLAYWVHSLLSEMLVVGQGKYAVITYILPLFRHIQSSNSLHFLPQYS